MSALLKTSLLMKKLYFLLDLYINPHAILNVHTQEHFMSNTTVADHFKNKPVPVRAIYDKLLALCKKIGDITEDPKKTSIHLVRDSALAGIEVRQNYLLLNIKSDHALVSPRIAKSEQLSAKRYHQKVKLTSPNDVDVELKQWLKEAYGLSG